MLINGETNFAAKIINHDNEGRNYHNSLEISISQRTDETFSVSLYLNTVTKDDLLKMSELFRDLAGQIVKTKE